MKAFFLRLSNFFIKYSKTPALSEYKHLSPGTIRKLIWIRIVGKIYIWLLSLYLIAKFAGFIKSLIMP
jgi:hypothetical protein